LLGGAQYAQSFSWATALLGATLLSIAGSFMDTSAGAEKRTWLMSLGVTLGVVVNFVLNLVLIPRVGAYGAIIGALAGSAAAFAYRLVAYPRALAFRSFTGRGVAYALGCATALVVLARHLPGNLLLAAALLGATALVFRREVALVVRVAGSGLARRFR
jgi:O-antigen/teichoic acid export membrane protein